MSKLVHGSLRALLGFVLLAFCAAPVPGDAGGCGERAEPLDAGRFFQSKATLDCQRCQECRIGTKACQRACSSPASTSFPSECAPLLHDGEVCLRALDAASCDDYTLFMADSGASLPTECDFCGEQP